MSGAEIGIVGAGAFGAALGVALARAGRRVTVWARDARTVATMRGHRAAPRLPGVTLPDTLTATDRLDDLAPAQVVLLALPMQALRGFLAHNPLPEVPLVACCKGVDLHSLTGPVAVLAQARPGPSVALLTGPSFAADIARGLPTALTLACADETVGVSLQHALSTPVLRLYHTTDVVGAELGGALKNVIAIAAGVVMGAGLGDSARAALMTRGYAEISRLALAMGARAETLAGLSGLGDLVLTCTSAQSRNFGHGHALGAGQTGPQGVTVEGVATARAVVRLAAERGLDLPITTMVARLTDGQIALPDAIRALMSRPLKAE